MKRLKQREDRNGVTDTKDDKGRWALTALDEAINRLADRYDGTARHELFDGLRPFLTSNEPGSFAELAVRFGVTENALRVALYRLRRQFASILREVIAETGGREEKGTKT